MNKKTKQSIEPDFKITIPTGNKEAIVTGVYKVRQGGILDVNTASAVTALQTNVQVERQIVEGLKKEFDAIKFNPFSFQSLGRDRRLYLNKTESLLGGKPTGKGSFRLKSNRETADYVNAQIKKLIKAENIQRPAQLIEKFKTSKLVRAEFSSQQTFVETGMVLKRIGLAPQDILTLVCERILQRKDLKQRYLSKNTPSLEGFLSPSKNEGQAGYELIAQWYAITIQNRENVKVHWRTRKPNVSKQSFYKSKVFNDWCIKFNVPKPSTYSNFVKFLNTLISDYKKFCRSNKIQVLPYI